MGLPAPPSEDFSFIEWALGAVGAVAAFTLAAVWRVAAKAGGILSDVKALQEWRKEFTKKVDDDRAENNRRHEENLKALGKIPDIDDFRRFEDRVNDNLREIKESLGLRPRRGVGAGE